MKLRVENVTHDSVFLSWEPGFHGGMDQFFRIRFKDSHDEVKYYDVYPANSVSTILDNLDPGQTYSLSVMAFNNIGESNYTNQPVLVQTSGKIFNNFQVIMSKDTFDLIIICIVYTVSRKQLCPRAT